MLSQRSYRLLARSPRVITLAPCSSRIVSSSFSTSIARCNAPNSNKPSDEESLLKQLKDELKDAMRAKDTNLSATLRNLLSEHQYAQKQQGGTPSTLLSIIQKAIARRHEAAESYTSAKRDDLAEKEKQEASYISKFLPQQLSGQELRDLISQAVSAAKGQGVETKKVLGWVMKEIKGRVEGRTDNKKLKDVVQEVINGDKK
ncbi:unnamed protein product [Sympodiomycopsis kandeliae]